MRRKDRELTDIGSIEEILTQCKTCHVAMVDNGSPYVVPLSYGYKVKGNILELYFHSAPEGKKLDILKRNKKVCFEVSYEGDPVHSKNPCNSGSYFASVIGYGDVVFIENVDEMSEAISVMFKHQSGKYVSFTAEQVKGVCVFKIVSKEFTGKKKSKSKPQH